MTAVTGRSGVGQDDPAATARGPRPARRRRGRARRRIARTAATRSGSPRVRRQRIGYLPQEPSPIGFLSAQENVALALRLRGWGGGAADRASRDRARLGRSVRTGLPARRAAIGGRGAAGGAGAGAGERARAADRRRTDLAPRSGHRRDRRRAARGGGERRSPDGDLRDPRPRGDPPGPRGGRVWRAISRSRPAREAPAWRPRTRRWRRGRRRRSRCGGSPR